MMHKRFPGTGPSRRCRLSLALLVLVGLSGPVRGQEAPPAMMHGHGGDAGASHHAQMMAAMLAGAGNRPVQAGQDAFAAVQEVVRLLEADPATDWSRVDIAALRRHLIDMNEVTLQADARTEPVEGGARFIITGTGRTVAAIRRMIPAHSQEINSQSNNGQAGDRMGSAAGWSARVEPLADGVVWTVTATDPAQAARIRALGYLGILVQGDHHALHHLAIARGEAVH